MNLACARVTSVCLCLSICLSTCVGVLSCCRVVVLSCCRVVSRCRVVVAMSCRRRVVSLLGRCAVDSVVAGLHWWLRGCVVAGLRFGCVVGCALFCG